VTLDGDKSALFEDCIAAESATSRGIEAFRAFENVEADQIATHHRLQNFVAIQEGLINVT